MKRLKEERLGGQAIVAGIVSIIVASVLIFSALLPILNTSIGASNNTAAQNLTNLSGYAGTNAVAQTLPLFIVLGVLLLIIGLFLTFRR